MRFKVILAIFLLASITLLLFASRNQNIFGKIGEFKIPTGFNIFPIAVNQKPTRVVLEGSYMPLEEFETTNSTVRIEGICTSSVKIGDTSINLAGKRCQLIVYNPAGHVVVAGKNVILEAAFSKAIINALPFSSKGRLKVTVLPSSATISLSAEKLQLNGFKGKLLKLTSDGEVVSEVNFPPCKEINSGKFVGTLNVENGTISLTGIIYGLNYRCE